MSTIDVRQDTVKFPAPRSPAGEAFNDVLVLVLRLHGSFTGAGEALAKPAGQTLARWVVLDQCRNTPATVSDIARRLRLARQSVQRIADLLTADGLCAWRDNPHHQRAKLLALTPAGRAALSTIDVAQHRWCDTLGNELGEPTLRRTAAALQRITDAVDNTRQPQQRNAADDSTAPTERTSVRRGLLALNGAAQKVADRGDLCHRQAADAGLSGGT